MIATGNHNFERFAALCNAPEVEPRALRAIPTVAYTKQFLRGIVIGRVREPTYGDKPVRLCPAALPP